jgi:hypothetical protein
MWVALLFGDHLVSLIVVVHVSQPSAICSLEGESSPPFSTRLVLSGVMSDQGLEQ